MNKKTIMLLLFVVAGVYHWRTHRFTDYGPGMVAPAAPYQKDLTGQASFAYKGYQITPLTKYVGTVRVLTKKRYFMDRLAKLSPFDLGIGWGRMSDEAVIKKIKISQSRRFLLWSSNHWPIPGEEVQTSAANIHVIPANDGILKKLKKIKRGDQISFYGNLVGVTNTDGWRWRSSTTRKDTGAGACEILWMEELSIR